MKEELKHVHGILIDASGDPDTGIQPVQWDIKGDFYFDSEQDMNTVLGTLEEAFEVICGEPATALPYRIHEKNNIRIIGLDYEGEEITDNEQGMTHEEFMRRMDEGEDMSRYFEPI